MIQHNDSDTSCMRALVPAERIFASETEHVGYNVLVMYNHEYVPAKQTICCTIGVAWVVALACPLLAGMV